MHTFSCPVAGSGKISRFRIFSFFFFFFVAQRLHGRSIIAIHVLCVRVEMVVCSGLGVVTWRVVVCIRRGLVIITRVE